ncbi:type II toxin-antitoxin system HicA family toxin [Desulfofundulus luciae]
MKTYSLVTVPHPKKSLPAKTVKSIFKQAEIEA